MCLHFYNHYQLKCDLYCIFEAEVWLLTLLGSTLMVLSLGGQTQFSVVVLVTKQVIHFSTVKAIFTAIDEQNELLVNR